MKVKCPKCGCTEIDDGKALLINKYGEVEGVDYDPRCKNCGYPLGDDWIEEGESC